MKKYNPKEIEKKWQKKWDKEGTFMAKEDRTKQKFYSLIEFPYPSGAGLHVGHPRPFTAMDVVSRKKRMEGFNVLYPIGFDAFGLPTENYAIKTGRPPAEVTQENIANFTRQLKSLGYSFDWSRVVDTTDPKYFKWTQWIFLQLYKHGLAYKKNQPINWCPKDKIGLANEEVVQGCCERCGTPVEQRNKEQWMLGITKYADKLLEGLKEVDYITPARVQQENWIGKSEGAEVDFTLRFVPGQKDDKHKVRVFTTRPDTIFGVTFVAVSAELANSWLKVGWQADAKVKKYIEATLKERVAAADRDEQEKTGVDTGVKAVNPVNGEEIPVWVTNYVMGGVGTGAIMGVPAHDERDFEFAKKFGLPIKQVVAPYTINTDQDAPRSEQNIVKFSAGTAVIKHWEKDLYYVVDFSEQMQGLVGGHVEPGETPMQAARREVTEESGYKNVKSIKTVLEHAYGRNFKTRKMREEECHDAIFLAELADGERVDIIDKETKKGRWMSAEEIFSSKLFSNVHRFYFEQAFRPSAYTEAGKIVNSGQFDGLFSDEAKEKIIAWLEEKGVGKRKVNYKLRDWVFSRQRYWGEPIPLVHCEACKNRKYNYILLHGFSGSSKTNFFPWLKKELEKKGEVFCPDLPKNNQPSVTEQADFVLKNAKIDENTVIVGHSLGGAVLLNMLEKIKKPIAKAVLVDSLHRADFADEGHQGVRKSHDWKFDFKKIKKNAKEFVLLGDESGEVVPVAVQHEMQKLLDARLSITKPQGVHFHNDVEPEVLSAVEETGWIPLPESELPLELPTVKKYEPTDTGESPLAAIEKWVKTKCPRCGGPARRETDTMPNWAGSSWYFLRYVDPKNDKNFFKAPSFNFRAPITPTEKDLTYFNEFKEIYSTLKKQNIDAWAVNRFLVNGLNRSLWMPLRTVAFMAWEKDLAWIADYLKKRGYKLTDPNKGGDLYEKDGLRVEAIPLHNVNGKIHSFTRAGVRQELEWSDLPLVEFGNLFGFSFRTVAPEYNLEHYKFIAKHEADARKGLGDQDKIDFLQEWVDSKNNKLLYWNQVDWYNGGMEHTVLHLLYSRFWNQFLFDLGLVPTLEPYKKRTSHGMILGPDGEKMSKSRGNVINPDEMVEQFGTDAFRTYIMFMGPFDQFVQWDTNGLVGVRRFLERVWNLQEFLKGDEGNSQVAMHQTIKKVGEDIDKMAFNTAIAKLMELVNYFSKEQKITKEEYDIFTKLVSPFAPHLAEEIWTEVLGHKKSLAYESWPTYQPELTVENKLTLAVQINGKVRDTLEVAADITEEKVKELVMQSEKVTKWLEGKQPKKVIYVKGKLVSIVV